MPRSVEYPFPDVKIAPIHSSSEQPGRRSFSIVLEKEPKILVAQQGCHTCPLFLVLRTDAYPSQPCTGIRGGRVATAVLAHVTAEEMVQALCGISQIVVDQV